MESAITLAPELVAALLAWYDANQRDLPWRHTPGGPHPDPYHVLVSEIMLQQTTVAAVVPYFQRWTQAFPTIESLSGAEPEEVLRLWEGLGYYSRARNLHAAAREVVENYGMSLPRDPALLRKLPGIGEYTAAAVASIAYGVRAAALDANNLRVWSRLLATGDRKRIGRVFGRALPADRPGDTNQALMDLGSTLCTPREPACPRCPLAPWCRARRTGRVSSFPPARSRPGTVQVEAAIGIILRDDGRVLVQQRPETGLLAGLFEFPGGKVGGATGHGGGNPGHGDTETRRRGEEDPFSPRHPSAHASTPNAPMAETPEEAVVREIREETGLRVQVCEKLGVFTHAYTRFRVKLHVFLCKRKAGRVTNPSAKWVTLQELEGLAMPSVNRRIVKKLEDQLNTGCDD